MSDIRDSIEKLDARFHEIAQEAISLEEIPGGMLWIRAKEENHTWSFGETDFGNGIRPGLSTSYDIGSIGKMLVSFLIWKLIEEKKIDKRMPVSSIMPVPFMSPSAKDLTLLDLLAYRPFYVIPKYLQDYSVCRTRMTGEEWFTVFFATAKIEMRGEQYNNISPLILGRILEHVSGKGLDLALQDMLFEPLGMWDTRFDPFSGLGDYEKKLFIAPTEKNIELGTPHDPMARMFRRVPIAPSGLFSTIRIDMPTIADILAGGNESSSRFISQHTYESMKSIRLKLSTDYLPHFPLFCQHAFFTTSATGCCAFGANHSEIGPFSFVFLSNTVAGPKWKTKIDGHPPIYWIRRKFLEALLTILGGKE